MNFSLKLLNRSYTFKILLKKKRDSSLKKTNGNLLNILDVNDK